MKAKVDDKNLQKSYNAGKNHTIAIKIGYIYIVII